MFDVRISFRVQSVVLVVCHYSLCSDLPSFAVLLRLLSRLLSCLGLFNWHLSPTLFLDHVVRLMILVRVSLLFGLL